MDYDEPTTFYVPEFDQEYDVSSFFSCSNNSNDETTISSFSNKNKKRRHSSNNKNENGCYTFTRTINDVRVKIPCFATKSIMGTKIKSATTGLNNNMYVGKNDEDLFFKVRIVNGDVSNSSNGNDFYYDSPEEYERHLFAKVSQSIKDKWKEKNQTARLNKLILEKLNKTEKQQFVIVK
jgi:Fe-S cluster biosynthesis and repair protein YggX